MKYISIFFIGTLTPKFYIKQYTPMLTNEEIATKMQRLLVSTIQEKNTSPITENQMYV